MKRTHEGPEIQPSPALSQASLKRIQLTQSGLSLFEDEGVEAAQRSREVSLLAGAVAYFALEPEYWQIALEQLKGLGLQLLDLSVPWCKHEISKGKFDFGEQDPRLNLRRFIRIAESVGLLVSVRPGPYMSRELSGFGVPERVLWAEECQAKTYAAHPLIIPALPRAFPLPSYASRAFHAELEAWYRALSPELSGLTWPEGPIVLLQLDAYPNGRFPEQAARSDYREECGSLFQRFLAERYDQLESLNHAYGAEYQSFDELRPPHPSSFKQLVPPSHIQALRPHLDWASFQEQLAQDALQAWTRTLQSSGLSELPIISSLPNELQEASAHQRGLSAHFYGLHAEPFTARSKLDDASYLPTEITQAPVKVSTPPEASERSARCSQALQHIAERAGQLSAACELHGTPSFAASVRAGYPALLSRNTLEHDAFEVLCALAHGVRGFSLNRAVGGERWLGAPIQAQGALEPHAEFWRDLISALERTEFSRLSREAQVGIVSCENLRRLTRLYQAIPSASLTNFDLAGWPSGGIVELSQSGADQLVRESLRLKDAATRSFESAGIIIKEFSEALLERAVESTRWLLVLGLEAADEALVMRALNAARQHPARVSLGPDFSSLLSPAHPLNQFEPAKDRPFPWRVSHVAELEPIIAQLKHELGPSNTPPHELPAPLKLCLHRNARGEAKVAFIINPSSQPLRAQLHLPQINGATHCLTRQTIELNLGVLSVQVAPESVCMLELHFKA